MPRSLWKGPFFINFPHLTQSIKENKYIKTNCRNCTIMPHFIGAKFLVHTGNNYVPVEINEQMIGKKLGEFAFTRKPYRYTSKK